MRIARPVVNLSLSLCTLALSAGTLAETHEGAESDIFGEVPTVLTASRLVQSPLDAPAPVTVIDRQTILDSGFTEIHDVFRLVPGFLVADWPNGSPIVVNQGLGDAYSRRLLVLLDGRALYNPFKGGVDWQDLPLRLDDIDRIEVVRGANAASYGANAFQGVINIITRVPIGEHETGVVLRAGKGDIGDLYAHMTRGDGAFNWRISASARQATNFRNLGLPSQYYQEDIQRQAFNGQFVWTPRPEEEYSLRLGLSNGRDDIGNPIDFTNPARDVGVQDVFLDAGWKRSAGQNTETSLRYYHYGRRVRDDFVVLPINPLAVPSSLTLQYSVDVRRDDLEYQQSHAWSDDLSGLWGVGLRHDAVEAPGSLSGLGSVGGWQWQVFGNLDWEVAPKWLLHAGGMLEKHYNTGLLASPRLALNYHLTPAQSLRLSLGRAYRAPTVFESSAREMVTWSGGIAEVAHYAYQDLEPEKLDFVELGYIGHLQPQGLRIDARLYLNEYGNYIDDASCYLDPLWVAAGYGPGCGFPVPAGYDRPQGYYGQKYDPANPLSPSSFGHPKAYFFYNSGNIRVHGGDLSLDWASPAWGRFRFGHSITRISAISADRDTESSAPRHSTTLLWTKRFPGGLRLSLAGYWVGAMKWLNEGDDQPAYRRFDARLGKTLDLLGRDDELSITLQNFNSEHTEFHDFLVERRAFLSYRVNF
jgi:iron complex outermembrane receptor protein